MQGKILIGTSGYSYRDWVGPVYPEGTKPNQFLSHYQQIFDFTELNFSFYTQPNPAAMERLCANTKADFRFAVKANRTLTHEIHDAWPQEAARFRRGIDVLKQAGKLAAVLLQFPYRFHYTDANRRYLANLCATFKGYPVVLEFRNRDWFHESVLTAMEEKHLALAIPDLPPLQGLPRPAVQMTANPGYIRFHGHNQANWWTGDNTSRYDYLYSDPELADWVQPITRLADKAQLVLVAFNNHYKGKAVRNALGLQRMLGLPPEIDPAPTHPAADSLE